MLGGGIPVRRQTPTDELSEQMAGHGYWAPAPSGHRIADLNRLYRELVESGRKEDKERTLAARSPMANPRLSG
jgi:hypothetical protein